MAYKRRDAGGGAREAYGNYAISSKYTHRLYTPKSDEAGKITELKMFCSVDPVDGILLPQVVPVDGDPLEGISDAFHAAEFVSFLGTKKCQFITDTTDFPEKIDSPTRLFYNKIKEFIENEGKKKRPDWTDWFEWGGGAQLPSCVMMVQGVLIRLNGEPCKDRKGKPGHIAPIVLVLNRSATMDLETKLTTKVDSTQPISTSNSTIGDITSSKEGRSIVIDSYINSDGGKRYKVDASKISPLDEQYVKASFIQWGDLLRKENASWQINRLVETFDAASVDLAISSDPEYGPLVPVNVRGAFEGKVFIPNPAIPPEVHPEVAQVLENRVQSPELSEAARHQEEAVTSGKAVYKEPAQVMNIITAEDADAVMDEVIESTTPKAPADVENNEIMKSLIAEKQAALRGDK